MNPKARTKTRDRFNEFFIGVACWIVVFGQASTNRGAWPALGGTVTHQMS